MHDVPGIRQAQLKRRTSALHELSARWQGLHRRNMTAYLASLAKCGRRLNSPAPRSGVSGKHVDSSKPVRLRTLKKPSLIARSGLRQMKSLCPFT